MDYPQLYKQLNQAIIDADGKLTADTQAFINEFTAALAANGYVINKDAEQQLTAYLTAMRGAVRTNITHATTALTPKSLQSKKVLALTKRAFTERWHDGLTLSDRLWTWESDTKSSVLKVVQNHIKVGAAVNKTLYEMQYAIERSASPFEVVSNNSSRWTAKLAKEAKFTIYADSPEVRADWQKTLKQVEKYIFKLKETGTRHSAITMLDNIKAAIKKGDELAVDKALKWWLYDKQLYNLKRIARTEMATAAHRAVIASTLNDETIIGYQWRLSSAHKDFDICDYYASVELGYGKGVWTKEKVPQQKAHPHCSCLLVPRVIKINQTGFKNFEAYVATLPPEQYNALVPQWARQEIKNGIPLKKLLRGDGMGVITQREFKTININAD